MKLPRTPSSSLSGLGCGGRSFDIAFIFAIVYFKKARRLAGIVMKCQGGLEVAAVKSFFIFFFFSQKGKHSQTTIYKIKEKTKGWRYTRKNSIME